MALSQLARHVNCRQDAWNISSEFYSLRSQRYGEPHDQPDIRCKNPKRVQTDACASRVATDRGGTDRGGTDIECEDTIEVVSGAQIQEQDMAPLSSLDPAMLQRLLSTCRVRNLAGLFTMPGSMDWDAWCRLCFQTNRWCVTPKVDGVRVLVCVLRDRVYFVQRSGQTFSAPLSRAGRRDDGRDSRRDAQMEVYDGEWVHRNRPSRPLVFVFDYIVQRGRLHGQSYHQRYQDLLEQHAHAPLQVPGVDIETKPVVHMHDTPQVTRLLSSLRAVGVDALRTSLLPSGVACDGLIFARRDADVQFRQYMSLVKWKRQPTVDVYAALVRVSRLESRDDDDDATSGTTSPGRPSKWSLSYRGYDGTDCSLGECEATCEATCESLPTNDRPCVVECYVDASGRWQALRLRSDKTRCNGPRTVESTLAIMQHNPTLAQLRDMCRLARFENPSLSFFRSMVLFPMHVPAQYNLRNPELECRVVKRDAQTSLSRHEWERLQTIVLQRCRGSSVECTRHTRVDRHYKDGTRVSSDGACIRKTRARCAFLALTEPYALKVSLADELVVPVPTNDSHRPSSVRSKCIRTVRTRPSCPWVLEFSRVNGFGTRRRCHTKYEVELEWRPVSGTPESDDAWFSGYQELTSVLQLMDLNVGALL